MVRIGRRRGTTFELAIELVCRFGRPRGRAPRAPSAAALGTQREHQVRITGRIAIAPLLLEHEATSDEARAIAARVLDMAAWQPAARDAHAFRIG